MYFSILASIILCEKKMHFQIIVNLHIFRFTVLLLENSCNIFLTIK